LYTKRVKTCQRESQTICVRCAEVTENRKESSCPDSIFTSDGVRGQMEWEGQENFIWLHREALALQLAGSQRKSDRLKSH